VFNLEKVFAATSADTQKQLAWFSDSVSKQMQEAIAPVTSRVSAIKRENELVHAEGNWGCGDDDFMEYTEVDAVDAPDHPSRPPFPVTATVYRQCIRYLRFAKEIYLRAEIHRQASVGGI
jgi:hypothetical protein